MDARQLLTVVALARGNFVLLQTDDQNRMRISPAMVADAPVSHRDGLQPWEHFVTQGTRFPRGDAAAPRCSPIASGSCSTVGAMKIVRERHISETPRPYPQ